MSIHPYWAYEAVPGSLTEDREKKALAEGRRAYALDLATRRSGGVEYQLERAAKFEAYLKGEAVEDVNGAPLVPVEPAPWEANIGPEDRGAL